MTQPQMTSESPAYLMMAVELLGGERILKTSPRDNLQAHDMILGGIPSTAVEHLVSRLFILRKTPSLNRALGRGTRTAQRQAGTPRNLDADQSGRAWLLAEILAKATTVFGTQEAAERWMSEPAMGLDQKAPIDLLATPTGAEQVKLFLIRLEYGSYS